MAGNDTSSGGSTTNRDRSFIGNGCPNTWKNEPPLNGGSITACVTRILQTQDGEDQKVGTLYSFMAATSGSGGTDLTEDNTIAPDSFCPLGWQLSYGGTSGDYYDKSKSWNYLSNSDIYSSSYDFRKYPMSSVLTGYINFETGALFNQTISGDHWSNISRTYSTAYRNRVGNAGGIIINDSANGKNNGGALRCGNFSHPQKHQMSDFCRSRGHIGEFAKDAREYLCYFCKHNHEN